MTRDLPTTVALAGLCVAATALARAPGPWGPLGEEAADPVVRLLTAPFVHGFSAASALPHLAGNLALLLYAGSRVERVLGTRRFALLSGTALGAYAATQLVWSLEVNGASVFIWAYGPPLAVAESRRGPDGRLPAPTGAVLFVMWIAVPLLMTGLPYAFGWSGSPVAAFLVANAFHLSATAVGAGAAMVWKRRLRAPRRRDPGTGRTTEDGP